MRHKNESAGKIIKGFLHEMQRLLGVGVRTIQSDRGSEYFSQVGDTHQDRDRRQAELSKACDAFTPKVHHIVAAVEQKEKLAEVFSVIVLKQQIQCYGMLTYRPFSGLTQSHIKSSQELLHGIYETFLEPATGRGKARQPQVARSVLCVAR